MNGNDLIEYIEEMNGCLEEMFIEEHKDTFMAYAEEHRNDTMYFRCH